MIGRRSPFLPTTLETFLLAIYPTTLLVGTLFGLLDPATRVSPYNSVSQSHYAHTAPSYFAKKSNLFNVLFVKKGWAWVTVSFFFFLLTHPSMGPSFQATAKRIKAVLRWCIITVWWIFVTQWFFGPAIIDRGFRLTGGTCDLVALADAGIIEMDDTKQFVTGMACKAVGGTWKGGHDISGHVFLLVLGSMFLLEEVLNVVWRSAKMREERTVVMCDGAVKSAFVESEVETMGAAERSGEWTLATKGVVGVAALSVYMLMMTAAYFHTWFEKFTGLLVALSGIFVVYFLPRAVPGLRSIIGMPGV
ncbi:inositol phospholipid synthesis and fat-storage-inducing TM-domain-containing protein [Calycina marina]|uniref:Acyl-coenzyme A diphosphatase SCS3 n=1 Tax=Calycina marina TaxID=1763456 RepID=A0A9P7ZA48_9HELO|nr:inositol phospholipid synthesis and fat-storage-inducing TM-domain-containing protein [Calycina marina]